MTATARPTLRHVPALDGLRGLAVAGVVAYHAGFTWAPGGYLGVSAFFTLSGFLITSLLLVEWDDTGRISLGRFWNRRFRRLLPAALAVIAGVVVVAPFFADSGQLADLRGDVFAGIGYVANWRFVFEHRSYGELFTGPSPLQHLWSLAIEEQFYLVFPLLTVALLRLGGGRRRVLAATFGILTAASLAWMVHLGASPSGAARSYYDTGARACELLVGVLLALVVAGHGTRLQRAPRFVAALGTAALGAVLLSWMTVPQDSAWVHGGGLAVHAVLMAAVLAAAHVPGPVRSLGSTAPLRLAGRVSYGMYLIHWPVFVWLDAQRAGVDGIALFLVRMAVTVGLTAVSYHFIEQPVRTGRRLGGIRGLTGALAAASCVLLAAMAVSVWAVPRDDLLVALDNLPSADAAPVASPAGTSATTMPGTAATVADHGVVDDVLLVGDSVMSQASTELASAFAAEGVTTAYAGGPGTGPLSPQGSWAEQVDAWVAGTDPDVVVIEACCNYTTEPEHRYVDEAGTAVAPGSAEVLSAWETEIRDLIHRAGARGARVALVRFAPVQTNGFYGPLEAHVAAVNALYERLAAEAPELQLIDWSRALAPAGVFTWDVVDDTGQPVRVRLPDGVHLTPAGSELVSAATVAAVLDGKANADIRRS